MKKTMFLKAFFEGKSFSRQLNFVCCMLFLLVGQMVFAQGYVTLGSQVSESGNTSSSPVNGYFKSRHIQVIYTAAELALQGGATGNIQRLAWDVSAVYADVLPSYTIKMSHITTTDIPTSDFIAGGVVVKNGFNYSPALGFNDITFDTPFNWNGTDNILIDICFSDAFYFGFGGIHGQLWNYGGVANSYRDSQSDFELLCDSTTSNNTVAVKPRVRFFMQQASCLPPGALTVGAAGENTATINWGASASTPANGYSYYRSTSSVAPTAGATPTGTVAAGTTTVNLTGLTTSTSYYVWVKSNCGPGASSLWVGPLVFSTLCDSGDILTVTPGTTCGQGTVSLSATSSPGATLKWYNTLTGGASLGTGATFTTPLITQTTNYYVSAGNIIPNSTATVGAGASEDTSLGISPYAHSWGGNKTQFIVKASELQAAGVFAGPINSVAFTVTEVGTTYNDFALSIGTTTQNAATTTQIEGLTPVYSNASQSVQLGLNVYTFTTPFVWNGTSNIVIQTCYSNVNTGGTSSKVKYDTLDFVASTYTYADNKSAALICAATTGEVDGSGGTSTTSSRAKMTFNATAICESARTAVLATVNASPVLTLSATPAAICAGQTSTPVTITTGASDYNTYVWTPSTGVSGNATTGWTFNPSVTTTYTLNATQSTGTMCAAIPLTVKITVNLLPSTITIPATLSACAETILPITANGGTVSTEGTIGTGTTLTGDTEQPTAFCNRWPNYWNQIIYTAQELTAAGLMPGNINSLSFNINTLGSGETNPNYTIKIGATSAASFADSNFLSTTNFTTVYGPTTYTHTENGWQLITFTTPYVWDGTSNIVINITHDGANSSNNAQTYYTETTDDKLLYERSYDEDTTTGTLSKKRLNIKFQGSQSTNITWSPVTNLYTNAAATTPYVAGTNAKTVYFKSSTAAPAVTYTITGTSAASCVRTATTAVTVSSTVAPTVPAPVQDFCNAGTVANLNATGTALKWYSAATGGTALLGTVALVDDTVYYVSQTLDGCESPRVGVTVNINVTPAPTVAAPVQDFCNAGTVANLNATGTDIKWYAAATGGTALDPLTALTDDTIYYASQTIGTCESATRTALTANVNVTAAPTGLATQAFCNAGTVNDFTVTGEGIVWYDAATGGNVVSEDTALVNGTIYYASQTVSECESVTRLAVEAVITTVTVEDLADVNECYQYTLPVLTNGAYFTEANGAGTPLNAGGVITQTTTIYIYNSAGTNPVCTAESSFVVTIANIPAPTGDAVQTISVDAAADATIADIVVSYDGAGAITWYGTEEDASNGTNPLSEATILVDGEDYYAIQTIGDCTSALAFKVTIDVVLGRDVFNKDTFNYHPNPVNDILNLSYTSEITSVTVFNLLGQKVLSQQPNATDVKVDMSSLADGAYVVNVASANAVKTIKVIKKQ